METFCKTINRHMISSTNTMITQSATLLNNTYGIMIIAKRKIEGNNKKKNYHLLFYSQFQFHHLSGYTLTAMQRPGKMISAKCFECVSSSNLAFCLSNTLGYIHKNILMLTFLFKTYQICKRTILSSDSMYI